MVQVEALSGADNDLGHLHRSWLRDGDLAAVVAVVGLLLEVEEC